MIRFMIIVFWLLPLLSFTQNRNSNYEVILAGGPGKAEFYNLESNMYVDYGEILAGYAAGLFQYHFTERLSLKTGVAYERNGGRVHFEYYDYTGYGDYTDCYLHSSYLSIPLTTQLEVGNRFRFYLNVGGYCSFLVNYSYEILSNGKENNWPAIIVSPGSHHEDMKLDLGVIGEAGFKVIILRKYAASIGLADHYGLLNSKKLPEFQKTITGDPISISNDSKNNAYYILIGLSCFLTR